MRQHSGDIVLLTVLLSSPQAGHPDVHTTAQRVQGVMPNSHSPMMQGLTAWCIWCICNRQPSLYACHEAHTVVEPAGSHRSNGGAGSSFIGIVCVRLPGLFAVLALAQAGRGRQPALALPLDSNTGRLLLCHACQFCADKEVRPFVLRHAQSFQCLRNV